MADAATRATQPTAAHGLAAYRRDFQAIDVAVYDAIARTPTPSLDHALRTLTQAANYSRLWLGSAALLATVRGRRGRRAALVGVASLGTTSAVTNLVCKPLARRTRPDAVGLPDGRGAPMPLSASFPSGHSASAFAFSTAVGGVLPYDAIPLRTLAAVVAYSRIHTGVHYPGDVIAGALLGTTLAQVTARLLGRLLP